MFSRINRYLSLFSEGLLSEVQLSALLLGHVAMATGDWS